MRSRYIYALGANISLYETASLKHLSKNFQSSCFLHVRPVILGSSLLLPALTVAIPCALMHDEYPSTNSQRQSKSDFDVSRAECLL